MRYDPIHHADVMRSMHDPEIRTAGAGIAEFICVVGALFLFGPIVWLFVAPILPTIGWFLLILLGIVGFAFISFLLLIFWVCLDQRKEAKKAQKRSKK